MIKYLEGAEVTEKTAQLHIRAGLDIHGERVSKVCFVHRWRNQQVGKTGSKDRRN